MRIKRSDFERLIADGYGTGAKTTAPSVESAGKRLPDADSGELPQPVGVNRLGTEELWEKLGATAANLSEVIAGGNPDEIAGAFRALADAARALGDAIAGEETAN